MAKQRENGISWTDETWNPLRGCTRVSEGCRNCYAEGVAARFSKPGQPYEGLAAFVGAKREPRWTGKVALAEHLLDQPLRWRKPRRIFVNSMSDLFHESVPDEWIDRVFAVMALAPQHTFQVLTKRPERMRKYLKPFDGRRADSLGKNVISMGYDGPLELLPWPLPNVWLGVSVEDQATADERVPLLLDTPAAKRFISAEPLLSAIDLSKWIHDGRREGISGTDRSRPLQGRDERIDLAAGEVDRWRRSVASDLHPEGAGRTQLGRIGQLSQDYVQGRRQTEEGVRTSHCLDGSEQASDSGTDGNQPYRREEAKQRPSELGTDDASAERAALSYSFVSEEERSARREELGCGCNRDAGTGDPSDFGGQSNDAAGDCGAIRHNAVGSLGDHQSQELGAPSLDWIIVGGESGPNARPMHPDWVRSLRDQCAAAGVSFFFKQWGEWVSVSEVEGAGPHFHFEDGATVRRVGKKAAGHLLDGKEHREFPA